MVDEKRVPRIVQLLESAEAEIASPEGEDFDAHDTWDAVIELVAMIACRHAQSESDATRVLMTAADAIDKLQELRDCAFDIETRRAEELAEEGK